MTPAKILRSHASCLAAVLCFVLLPAANAQRAGTVEFVQGEVRVRAANGQERVVSRGAAVQVGESVLTGQQGAVQMRMVDNAFVALRQDTEININEYRYGTGSPGTENAVLRLFKGTLRTFTGRITEARRDRFLTITPTSTIGIRGSGNVAFYSPNLGTLNHTIQGSHVTTSINPQGQPIGAPVVTLPGQTVQVLPGLPPVRIPTPPFLLQAATASVAPAGGQGQASQGSEQVSSEDRSGSSRASSSSDTTLASEPAPSAISATQLSTQVLSSSPGTVTPTVITGQTTLGAGLNLTSGTQTTSSGATLALGRAPTAFVGTSPSVFGTGRFTFEGLYPIPGSSGATFLGALRTNSLSGLLPSTALFFDHASASGAAVGAAWNVFDRGTATQCLLGAPCLALGSTGAPDSLSIAVISGGALGTSGLGFNALGDRSLTGLTEDFGTTSASPISFGRYQGGQVDVFNSDGTVEQLTTLGARSFLFAVREVPTSIPLTGSWHYVPVFATAPADSLGNLGTLNYASLDVNFTNRTVNPSVSISINNQNLLARGLRVPIGTNFGFHVTSSSTENAGLSPAPPFPLLVSCSGSNCAALPVGATGSAYGARIIGGFAGDGTANGAYFTYLFATRYDPTVAPGSGLSGAAPLGRFANDYIAGTVSFAKNSQISAPVLTPTAANYYVSYFPNIANTATQLVLGDYPYPRSSASFTGPLGNLGIASTLDNTRSIGGDTSGAVPIGALPNGITYGRYVSQDTSLSGPLLSVANQASFLNASNATVTPSTNTDLVVGALHWIQGPGLWPAMRTGALSGSVTFNNFAGLISDQNAIPGTINSASLSFDFDRQAVNTALQLATSGNAWSVSGSNLALDRSGAFAASVSASSTIGHSSITVTRNGSTTNIFGHLNGRLTGNLDGAVMSFSLGDVFSFSAPRVNGAIGFDTPSFSGTVDVLTPHMLMLSAQGTRAGIDGTTFGTPSTPAYSIAPLEYLATTSVRGVDPSRVTFNAQGGVVEYDGGIPVVSGTSQLTDLPVRLGIVPGGSAASGAIPAMPAIASGAASLAESGFDPMTGISWGRYTAGNFATVDRVTGLPIGSGTTSNGSVNHYLLSPVQSGPTVLPLSGTASYAFVGGTSPTDSAGFVGTLTSATLNANFSAKTIDTSLNLSVGPRTWSASASGVPIRAGALFEAQRFGSLGNLNMSCSGSGCNPGALAGNVTGAFTGSTGQGAGMAYSLNTGGASGVTVGGVAAFRR